MLQVATDIYLGSVFSYSKLMNLDTSSCNKNKRTFFLWRCYICTPTYTAKGVSRFLSVTRAVESLSVG